jgi:hypothetical protein
MLKKDESSSSVQTTHQLYNEENVNGYSVPLQPRQRSILLDKRQDAYFKIVFIVGCQNFKGPNLNMSAYKV